MCVILCVALIRPKSSAVLKRLLSRCFYARYTRLEMLGLLWLHRSYTREDWDEEMAQMLSLYHCWVQLLFGLWMLEVLLTRKGTSSLSAQQGVHMAARMVSSASEEQSLFSRQRQEQCQGAAAACCFLYRQGTAGDWFCQWAPVGQLVATIRTRSLPPGLFTDSKGNSVNFSMIKCFLIVPVGFVSPPVQWYSAD